MPGSVIGNLMNKAFIRSGTARLLPPFGNELTRPIHRHPAVIVGCRMRSCGTIEEHMRRHSTPSPGGMSLGNILVGKANRLVLVEALKSVRGSLLNRHAWSAARPITGRNDVPADAFRFRRMPSRRAPAPLRTPETPSRSARAHSTSPGVHRRPARATRQRGNARHPQK